MRLKQVIFVAALAALSATSLAQAQTPAETPTTAAPAPTWTGLPFSSLADYERLIPIGMSRQDLIGALGDPEAITPGREADQAYHYAYTTSDGSTLRAVIIVRDGAVFIRRLYISSPTGEAARVN